MQRVNERIALSRARIGASKSSSAEISFSTRPTGCCPTTSSLFSARYWCPSRLLISFLFLLTNSALFLGECGGRQCQYLRPVQRHPVQSSRMSSGWWFGSPLREPAFQRRHTMRQRTRISGTWWTELSQWVIGDVMALFATTCRLTKPYWLLGVRCLRPCSNMRWKSASTIVSRSQTWNRKCSARCCASSTRAKRPT